MGAQGMGEQEGKVEVSGSAWISFFRVVPLQQDISGVGLTSADETRLRETMVDGL